MLKQTILTLILTSMLVNAQTFTNTVNQPISRNTQLNYTFGTTADQSLVYDNLELWFSFDAPPHSELIGFLNHDGVQYHIADLDTPSTSPFVSVPIHNFVGTKVSGNWNLNLKYGESTPYPFIVKDWGINVVPEPSTAILMGLGSISLLIYRKFKNSPA